MKVTRKLLAEVKQCCHHGHGASIFADGTVMQAISSNDVMARGKIGGGWEYRIAYVDDHKITLARLQEIFDEDAAMTQWLNEDQDRDAAEA